MDNPKIITEGFTCEELADALMVKLRPFIQKSIREELEREQILDRSGRSEKRPITKTKAIEPEVSETGRYSATETCQILSVHRNTLRAHTDAGNIKCGIRKSNGRKFYTGYEILRFWKAKY